MQSDGRYDPTWSPVSLNVALTGEIGISCMYPGYSDVSLFDMVPERT